MDVPIGILDFHHVYAALVAALGKQVAFDEMLRERVRTILEYANDAVISIDSAGIVTQWNRTSESLFGWTSNEAMGRNIVDLIVPPAFRSSFVNILTHLGRLGKNSTTARRELLAVDRYGKELSVEVSLNVKMLQANSNSRLFCMIFLNARNGSPP